MVAAAEALGVAGAARLLAGQRERGEEAARHQATGAQQVEAAAVFGLRARVLCVLLGERQPITPVVLQVEKTYRTDSDGESVMSSPAEVSRANTHACAKLQSNESKLSIYLWCF